MVDLSPEVWAFVDESVRAEAGSIVDRELEPNESEWWRAVDGAAGDIAFYVESRFGIKHAFDFQDHIAELIEARINEIYKEDE